MSIIGFSDQELFERIRRGDPDAFELLFRAHYPGLLRFARGHLGNREEAEDAVHDLFLRIWRDRERLAAAENPRTYLLAAMRNRVIDLLRRRALQRRWIDPLRDNEDCDVDDAFPRAAQLSQSTSSASDAAALAELEVALRAAIEALPERCRTVFLLCREEGMSYAEVAEVMGVSPSTVKTQMARALTSLRAALASFLPLLSALYLASR